MSFALGCRVRLFFRVSLSENLFGLVSADLAHEEVPPADLAAVGLQHDRAFGGIGDGFVGIVLHWGTIDDELVIQPHPGAGTDLADAEAVPLAKVLVSNHERITPRCVRRVVEKIGFKYIVI